MNEKSAGFQDVQLDCIDCGSGFVFSAEEQRFHAGRGFTSLPRRCPACKAARRVARSAEDEPPPDRAAGGRELFSAVCAACGREARVPFAPRDGRPVLCAECFGTARSRSRGRSVR